MGSCYRRALADFEQRHPTAHETADAEDAATAPHAPIAEAGHVEQGTGAFSLPPATGKPEAKAADPLQLAACSVTLCTLVVLPAGEQDPESVQPAASRQARVRFSSPGPLDIALTAATPAPAPNTAATHDAGAPHLLWCHAYWEQLRCWW